jgi:hypothetical protein
MQEADVVALRESILDLLMARFAWRFLGPELVVEANELVRERFLYLDRSGVLPIEFADGAVLTGYEVAIDHERSSLGLTPCTNFRPSPRYPPIDVTGDQAIALGYRGKFDLWVARDETRPPNIIARYGEGADDYLSASPEILGLAIVRQIGEPFPEALRRLVLLGLLVDDDGGFDPAAPDARWPAPPAAVEPRPPRAPIDWRRMFPWWPRKT